MNPIKRHQPRSLRHRLVKEHPFCYWCGLRVFHSLRQSGLAASIDHVKPRKECLSQREYSAPDNQVLSCCDCNQRRNRNEVLVPFRGWFPYQGPNIVRFEDRPSPSFRY